MHRIELLASSHLKSKFTGSKTVSYQNTAEAGFRKLALVRYAFNFIAYSNVLKNCNGYASQARDKGSPYRRAKYNISKRVAAFLAHASGLASAWCEA